MGKEGVEMGSISTLFKIRTGDDPAAAKLLRYLQQMGYPKLNGLRIEHVLRVEREVPLEPQEVARLEKLFRHPMVEEVSLLPILDQKLGVVFEVTYKNAWTDPQMDSILHGAKALGVSGIEWTRLAQRYQLTGVSSEVACEIANRFLFNPQCEWLVPPGHEWDTLKPRSEHVPVQNFDLRQMTIQQLRDLSERRRLFLSDDKLLAIQSHYINRKKRSATDAEIEKLAAWWGDHCFHTTWKSLGLLQHLQSAILEINHPLVLSALVDNAGVMRFYDGWALAIKGETHISPMLADVLGAILTLSGGVFRDPMGTGQGAYPIAATIIIASRDPHISWEHVYKGTFHPRHLLRQSIFGIRDYNDPMGIPTVTWKYLIHDQNVKSIALGHCVGLIPEDRSRKMMPYVGDFMVLGGGFTGMDGIHGATVSSSRGTAKTHSVDAAHVQLGHPIEERIFMEAIPVWRDRGCIRALTDLGAAGLSCSGEMGSKVLKIKDFKNIPTIFSDLPRFDSSLPEGSGVVPFLSTPTLPEDLVKMGVATVTSGIFYNTAWVPLKSAGMAPWQIDISESQERMAFAVPPKKLSEFLEIAHDYGVRVTVIGIFTDTGCCQIIHDPDLNNEDWIKNPQAVFSGEMVCNLEYSFIDNGCPLSRIEVSEPKEKPIPFRPPRPDTEHAWVQLARKVLGHYNISDQRAAGRNYDQTVQARTVVPYGIGQDENVSNEIFVGAPLYGKPYAVGYANAINQFYGEVDPAGQGRLVMAQAFTKLVATGFSPDDIVFNVNVMTPPCGDNPENAWRLVQLVKDGYIYAFKRLRAPVISGKDSSNVSFVTEERGRIDTPLTVDVFAVGRAPDYQLLVQKPFAKAGDILYLFTPGLERIHLGGSILLDLYGERGDKLPRINLDKLRLGLVEYHKLLLKLGGSRNIFSRSVVAEGGILRRLFEMSLASSGFGCEVELPIFPGYDSQEALFGELNASILFASDKRIPQEFQHQWSSCWEIGKVVGCPKIEIWHDHKKLLYTSVDELAQQWSRTFEEVAL